MRAARSTLRDMYDRWLDWLVGLRGIIHMAFEVSLFGFCLKVKTNANNVDINAIQGPAEMSLLVENIEE